MMIMKLIIAGVLVALQGVRLARCLECVQGSAFEVNTIDATKASKKSTCKTSGSTKCHMIINPESRLNLTFGCGDCRPTAPAFNCTECTGDGCNGIDKEPFATKIAARVKCLFYHGPTSTLPRRIPEIYCHFLGGPIIPNICTTTTYSQVHNFLEMTYIGCELDCNKILSYVNRTRNTDLIDRCLYCTPNALKTNCVLSNDSGVAAPATNGTAKAGTTPATKGTAKVGTTPATNGTAKASTTPATNGTAKAGTTPATNGTAKAGTTPATNGTAEVGTTPTTNGTAKAGTTPTTNGTAKAGTTPATNGTAKAGTTPATNGTAKAGTTPATNGTAKAGTTTATNGTAEAGTTPTTNGTAKAGTTPATNGTAKAGTTPATNGTAEAEAVSHQTSLAGSILLACAMMLVTLLLLRVL